MPRDETSTPSHRVERGEPEIPDPRAEQEELSLGAMTRGTIGTEGGEVPSTDEHDTGSPGTEADRRAAGESP